MDEQVVLYTKENKTGVITINRPEARNALNMAVFLALEKILDEVAADDDACVLIVTGTGNSFVSGADINELTVLSSQEGWRSSRYQQSVFTKLERLGKPSIAAINGFALGGGLELALSCTFRVASKTAKLGLPELGLGIIPAFGGTERLTRTVGYARGSELLLFRTIMSAEQAEKIGLVNQVVEVDQLADKARTWARELASLSPTAVRLELELLMNQPSQDIDRALALEAGLAAVSVASPEAKELLGAFASKSKK
jgi:enoyl-CoA hydratase